MKSSTVPVCLSEGARVDIKNDLTPGKCAINLKRYDCVWTDWTEWSFWSVDAVGERKR